MGKEIEIVPAILRSTYEKIEEDWDKIYQTAGHVQIDITDGVFAGDGSFRQVDRFKQLPQSEKIELHMMVQEPANYVEDIVDLAPARCVFHIEAFAGSDDLTEVYGQLRKNTQTELALALNPASPVERIEERLGAIDYVLFMGYNPGWAGQDIDPSVYRRIAAFVEKYPEVPVAVDGHVDKETIEPYVRAGATILCSNSAIFKLGNAEENYRQLSLLAEAVLAEHNKV